MAQDQKQPNPATAPARQQSQVFPDSPFYTKDNMPADVRLQDARWLFGRDWKCQGDPDSDLAAWYPPGASDFETQKREPKMGYIRRVTGREKNGEPVVEYKHEQLMEQDGANPNNMGQPTIPVTQLVVVPPAQPVHRRLAVEMQLAREKKAKRDATKANVA